MVCGEAERSSTRFTDGIWSEARNPCPNGELAGARSEKLFAAVASRTTAGGTRERSTTGGDQAIVTRKFAKRHDMKFEDRGTPASCPD